MTPAINQHLVFLCVPFARLTLLQVKAYQFMRVPYSLPTQNPGKVLSYVPTAATRRMPWKENDQVELRWYEFIFILPSAPL